MIQFKSRKCIKFNSNFIYYLLNIHVNIVAVYFEINHRNELIILVHMEVQNNKMLFF